MKNKHVGSDFDDFLREENILEECTATAISRMQIETEQEEDGRWIAEVMEIPGVLAYGQTRQEAIAKVKTLALRVLADH